MSDPVAPNSKKNANSSTPSTLVNAPNFGILFMVIGGISLLVSYSYFFFTVNSGTSATNDIDKIMLTQTITPLVVCLVVFFIGFGLWFANRPSLNSQFATFILSYLSITISMFALLFSLYQVSVST